VVRGRDGRARARGVDPGGRAVADAHAGRVVDEVQPLRRRAVVALAGDGDAHRDVATPRRARLEAEALLDALLRALDLLRRAAAVGGEVLAAVADRPWLGRAARAPARDGGGAEHELRAALHRAHARGEAHRARAHAHAVRRLPAEPSVAVRPEPE